MLSPAFIKGNGHYAKVFGLISQTTVSLLKHLGLSDMLPHPETEEELSARVLKIGRATDIIFSRASELPLSQTTIKEALLVMPSSKNEYVIGKSHLLQIHALTPNDYIYKLLTMLGVGSGGFSAFLATKIILAFHQTIPCDQNHSCFSPDKQQCSSISPFYDYVGRECWTIW
jgi:hypothetical protein